MNGSADRNLLDKSVPKRFMPQTSFSFPSLIDIRILQDFTGQARGPAPAPLALISSGGFVALCEISSLGSLAYVSSPSTP